MNYSLEQLREAYEKLPENIRKSIDSVDSTDIMFELRKKYSLTIEQMGYIADETSFTMLGLTHPKDFMGNIEKKLGLDKKIVQDITKEINEDIFKPIKESLMGLHNQSETDTLLTEKTKSITDNYRESIETEIGATKQQQDMNEIQDETNKQENLIRTKNEELIPSKEELLKEIEGKSSSSTTPTPATPEGGQDFISKKLNSNTNIPSKEVSDETKTPGENIKYSSEDPYRESAV